jgi:hypothetical protein
MKAKPNKKTGNKNISKRKESPEFETMSQAQNRHGKGRQQNGSDGGSKQAVGNNH